VPSQTCKYKHANALTGMTGMTGMTVGRHQPFRQTYIHQQVGCQRRWGACVDGTGLVTRALPPLSGTLSSTPL